jgi:predicted tellurium resistance membrane protein TerC
MKGEALDFLWQDVSHAPFWIGVFQIIGVNVILSGDNAVVIALACMTLPPRQRLWGMILGAGVAVLLRVAFTVVVAQAMTYPYLRLIGGLLLFWVAIKLVVEDESGADGRVESARTLWRAVRHRGGGGDGGGERRPHACRGNEGSADRVRPRHQRAADHRR